MKPCQHCGAPLDNAGVVCPACGRAWSNQVSLNPQGNSKAPYPRYRLWGDAVLTILLTAVGFYLFGGWGILAGIALGLIIAFGLTLA